MKIAVLYGGTSAEREVSLSSGKGIMKALEHNGHEVIGIDFHPNRVKDLLALDVEIVFIGLHGKFGEDGRIQGLLDIIGIPYVGTGVLGSALAMDKGRSKRIFEKVGIRVSKDVILTKKDDHDARLADIHFGFPVVVKPVKEGSTIGLTIAYNDSELKQGVELAFKHDDEVMVEEFVAGKEVTVSVLGDRALPVIEIVSKNKFYDYEAKYSPGMSEHIVPARLSEPVTAILQKHAYLAHVSLGCDVYSRADFIVPSDGTEPVILEVNTLPGMTPTSLFPDAAKEIGLSYEDMIESLVTLTAKKTCVR